MYAMVASDVRARVSVHLDATPEAVFDAWVVPNMMERWFFKSPSNDITALTSPVPGGSYSITEYSSGKVIAHNGNYSVVERPRRLAFSLMVPKHFAGEAQIDVTIVPDGRKTRLDFVERGAGPDDAQAIWEKMLSNLARVLRHDPDGRQEDGADISNLATLDVLVGGWNTTIKMLGSDDDGTLSHAEDVYRWMPGNRFLLHDVHAVLKDGEMTGLEIISPSGRPGEFATRSYDSNGHILDARMTLNEGNWESVSETQRFRGRIAQDGQSANGQWQRLRSGRWEPWMQVELHKKDQAD
ncbi:hypothetical protein CK228_24660 [Mesorhizobium sp. WSM4312]|nr:hypothetical protein CK228_24660 [Mesorhizobium sp. WSM4312]